MADALVIFFTVCDDGSQGRVGAAHVREAVEHLLEDTDETGAFVEELPGFYARMFGGDVEEAAGQALTQEEFCERAV